MSLEDKFQELQLSWSWGPSVRERFYILLADFIKDGVPVYDALNEIGLRWASLKDPKAIIAKSLLASMRGRSGSAQRLGQAIGQWSPSMESIAIDAGEQAGDVVNGLRMAANLTNVKARVKKTIVGEMVYPAILILLFCGILVGINIQVIPILDSIVTRDLWPAAPYALGVVSDNVVIIVGVFLAFLTSVGLLYNYSVNTWIGEIRDRIDKTIFPWTMNRQISGAVMMTCFSALMRAGIPLNEIINRMSVSASHWERTHLFEIRNRMRRGMSEGLAMATDLFDSDAKWTLETYGKLTSFSEALEGLSARQIEELIKRIQVTMTLIRSLCMIGIAGTVVWVYYSFMQITLVAKSAASAMGT